MRPAVGKTDTRTRRWLLEPTLPVGTGVGVQVRHQPTEVGLTARAASQVAQHQKAIPFNGSLRNHAGGGHPGPGKGAQSRYLAVIKALWLSWLNQ